MDCNNFKQNINNLLDGELPNSVEFELKSHAQNCPTCNKLYNQYADMLATLKLIGKEDFVMPKDLHTKIMDGVKASEVKKKNYFSFANPRKYALVASVLGIVIAAGSYETYQSINSPTAVTVQTAPMTQPVGSPKTAKASTKASRASIDLPNEYIVQINLDSNINIDDFVNYLNAYPNITLTQNQDTTYVANFGAKTLSDFMDYANKYPNSLTDEFMSATFLNMSSDANDNIEEKNTVTLEIIQNN